MDFNDLFQTSKVPYREALRSIRKDFFHACISSDDPRKVKKILTLYEKLVFKIPETFQDGDLNLPRDSNGNTAFMIASGKGFRGVVSLLLSRTTSSPSVGSEKPLLYLDINAQNNHGSSALILAALNRQADVIKLLLENRDNQVKVNLNLQAHATNSTALIIAAKLNHSNIMEILLRHSGGLMVDLNMRDMNGSTALIHAVKMRNLNNVNTLIKYGRGLDVNVRDKQGNTALIHATLSRNDPITLNLLKVPGILLLGPSLNCLQIACINGQISIVSAILNSNLISNPTKSNVLSAGYSQEGGMTALHFACVNDHPDVVAMILRSRIDDSIVNKPDVTGMTPLLTALKRDRMKVVHALLLNSKGLDVNAVNVHGTSALMLASLYGHEAIVENLLFHKDLKINAKTYDEGYTSLMFAAKNGNTKIGSLLLQSFHNINLTEVDNVTGRTALHIAVESRKPDFVSLILSHDNSSDIVNAIDSKGLTPLHYAAKFGSAASARIILSTSKVADINAIGQTLLTPLLYCSINGHTDVAKVLLEDSKSKVDVNCQTPSGYTALMVALGNRHFDFAKAFLQSSPFIDIDAKNEYGTSPLMFCAIQDHLETLKVILAYRNGSVNINACNKVGQTALVIASQRGHVAIVKALLDHMNSDFLKGDPEDYAEKQVLHFGSLTMALSTASDFSNFNVSELILEHDIWSKFPRKYDDKQELKEIFNRTIQDPLFNCGICMLKHDEKLDANVITFCRHVFGRKCLLWWLKRNQSCPMCRSKVLPNGILSNLNH